MIKNIFHIEIFNVNVYNYSLIGSHLEYLAKFFNVIIRVLSMSVAIKNFRKLFIFSHIMKHDTLKVSIPVKPFLII